MEPHRGRERDPVRVLAINITAVDKIDIEVVNRPPAQADLGAWLGCSDGILPRADEAEHLRRQRPDIVRRAPVDAGAICGIVLAGDAVPLPAGIEIDAHDIRQPQSRGNSGGKPDVFVRDQVVGRSAGERQAPASNRGRDQVGFEFRERGGSPFIVGTHAAELHARFHRVAEIENACGRGRAEKIVVAGRGYPRFDLAGAGLADVSGVDDVGAARRPRLHRQHSDRGGSGGGKD